MRKRLFGKSFIASLGLAMGLTVALPTFGATAAAYGSDDPLIVVSMGDSYSAGEGIEPFYGQDLDRLVKMKDYDWLAHRSKLSWPGQLEFSGINGTMASYHSSEVADDSECKWYFVAVSGATTNNVLNPQKKFSRTYAGWLCWDIQYTDLPAQKDVFKSITDPVSYVTLTMGGNDVGFVDIITTCATKSTYLGSKALDKQMKDLWDHIDDTKDDLTETYKTISQEAGPQATIIVAGYPKLLDKDGKGAAISKKEATTVNTNVTKFNKLLNDLVEACAADGMDIYFADVEPKFDEDGGHQAYSDDPWINKIILGSQDQDIDSLCTVSSYSIHPNQKGAEAYASVVNDKIREIEEEKKKGTLSGKICRASDRSTPVGSATISIYKDDALFVTKTANESGNYVVTLPEGSYRVDVTADGYLAFSAYAEVTYGENTYMETFLLVEGAEGEKGTASGVIKNALTGVGVEGAKLTVRKGWNNVSVGNVVTTATTGADGAYSLNLPIGNYTTYVEKEGFISSPVNVIVQKNDSTPQDGAITPILSGEDYRIVLMWGTDPRDLDSHMVGVLTSGTQFHVYYQHKAQYDGIMKVCDLDVDDTTSFGPETITLHVTTDEPYYYYVYRYAGAGSVATSQAQVKVYQGGTQVATFNVPVDQGYGDYWNVFAIVNGQLQIKNTITGTADLQYANQ